MTSTRVILCMLAALANSATTVHGQRADSTDARWRVQLGNQVSGPEGPEAIAGLRVRLTALDSAGLQLRYDGIAVRADSTRFELRCRSASVRVLPGSLPTATVIAAPACDGSTQTILWNQVQEMRVRRARVASPGRTLGNVANGAVEGGLFGAFVGAIGAVVLDLTLTGGEDENGQPHPQIWWSHVRYGALGVGALGAATGGLAGIVWSRGIWIRVPLPDRK